MDMPKPGEAHGQLDRLAGNWEGEETMHPSQWDPKGGVAEGRMSGERSLNGFAVIGDYQQERNGQVTFSGHSVWTCDAKSGQLSLHWFDCMGSAPEVFTGTFEGDRLVMAHGGPMHARMTYDLSEPGVLKSSMEMSQDGENWMRLFDGVYRRK